MSRSFARSSQNLLAEAAFRRKCVAQSNPAAGGASALLPQRPILATLP
jgi:hypothetical protein